MHAAAGGALVTTEELGQQVAYAVREAVAAAFNVADDPGTLAAIQALNADQHPISPMVWSTFSTSAMPISSPQSTFSVPTTPFSPTRSTLSASQSTTMLRSRQTPWLQNQMTLFLPVTHSATGLPPNFPIPFTRREFVNLRAQDISDVLDFYALPTEPCEICSRRLRKHLGLLH
jgi:hypothetical protein